MINKVTVLFGKNKFLLNKKLEDEILKTKVEHFNITNYSLLESNINEILEDLITISLFSEEKVIVLKDFSEILKLEQVYINRFINYLKNPNPDVYLFICLDTLISRNYEIGKAISNYSYLIEVNDLAKKDYNNYIVDYLNDLNFTIENKAVLELITRTNYDLDLLMNELNKLVTYKLDESEISYNDVINLVSKNLEENVYEIVNNLLLNNNKKTIEIFYDLMEKNEDPIRIINNISNKIRQIIYAKFLNDKKTSQEVIAEYLKISSNQAYYVIRDSKKYDLNTLEKMLERLSNLDYNIKTGKIDKQIGLEMFILAN